MASMPGDNTATVDTAMTIRSVDHDLGISVIHRAAVHPAREPATEAAS
jgi:hypothetical protein